MTNQTKATAAQKAPIKVETTTAADEAAKKREEAEAAAPEKAEMVKAKSGLATAVNLVITTGDDGKPVEVLPGTVFKPAAVDVDFLTKHEAIREPTAGEIALYEQAQRATQAAVEAAAATPDETLG